MRRVAAAVGVGVLLVPLITAAQSAELRAQVREDLLKDPRTEELSSVEVEEMVDALVQKMEEEGTASDYLEAQNSFDVASLFSSREEPSVALQMIFSPLGLALALLMALLVAIGLLIRYRHNHKIPVMPDLL